MQLERNRGTRNAPPGDPGSLPQPDPVVHWGSEGRSALETDGKRKAKLLVICTHGGASLAVQDAFDPEKMTEIGAVMFAGPALKGSSLAQGFRSGSCSVWSSKESDGTVLVFMGSEVADDRAYGVAKAVVESIVAEKTLILDASPIQAVDSAADQPSLLRFLQTEAAQEAAPPPPQGGHPARDRPGARGPGGRSPLCPPAPRAPRDAVPGPQCRALRGDDQVPRQHHCFRALGSAPRP